jgi:predicted enzyme related to lactoylglutathione lyase
MARITWFEYFTPDAEKDAAFYKEAFGWTAEKWGDAPYWLVVTGDAAVPGIDGAIGLPPMDGMTQQVVNTISVDDHQAAVSKAVAAGATVVVPTRAAAGTGWLTYLADPAGIVFGIMQYDKDAK